MIAIKEIGKQLISIIMVSGIFIVGGCAAKTAPVESITGAEIAVKAAHEKNAANYAPLELKIAEDKLNDAKTAVQKEDFDEARRLAEEAMADARLAEAKALSEKSKKLAQDMKNSIETLRREIERTQKQKIQ